MINFEDRESIIRFKNDQTRNILRFLEEKTDLLTLDWKAYNEIRNVVRYEANRNVNRVLRLLGDDQIVRMTRAEDANR